MKSPLKMEDISLDTININNFIVMSSTPFKSKLWNELVRKLGIIG